MAMPPKISLVLADVDGTLVTEQKILTERARAAVHSLHEAGIRFAITSGRPPKGMEMLFDPLKLETPIAGFNGGLFVKRDLSIIEQKTLSPDVASQAIDLIRQHGLDAWANTPPKGFPNYKAGTEGPAEADELLARDGRSWRKL